MASGLFGTGARVGPISQTTIQPTGIPGSTFVRAPMREAGGNLRALADALGGLNSALQNFASVQKQQEEDPQSRANKEWIARRQQMSIDELREEARIGSADGIRVREDALNALLGERANDDFRRHWLEFYNTEFDRTSGDAAAEYERLRQEYAAGLPSEIARGSFYRLTSGHFQSWMEKDVEEKVSYAKQEINTTVVASFRNAIDDALNVHGKSAEEAAKAVFEMSASNRDFLGLSGQEQNDTIFRIAEEFALQGREDIARALLEGTRVGADGKTVPPIVKIAGYTDKALRLLEGASKKRDQMVRDNGFHSFVDDDDKILRGAFTTADAEARRGTGLYTDAQLASMVDQSRRNRLSIENKAATEEQRRALRVHSELEEQRVYAQAYSAMSNMGGINRIQDVEIPSATGEGTRKLSKQQIVDAVVSRFEEDMTEHYETLVANGMDPDQARVASNRMRLDWYAGNKIVNEEWSNTLNGIAGRASVDTLLQKGEVSKYLADSAELYRQLKAVNPAYLSTFLKDDASKTFLETFDNAVSNRRMTTEDALNFAATWTAQPEGAKARQMIDHQDAEELATRTLRSLGLDARNSNYSRVMDRIATMSKEGNMTEPEIKKALENEILDTMVPINGVLVEEHADLPDDWPEFMQLELERVASEQGERLGIEDASDLYIVAVSGESKWEVRSKSLGGMRVGDAITPATIQAQRTKREAEQAELARKLREAKDAEKAEYQRQYDAEIAAERERIRFWQDAAGNRQRLRKSLAQGIAERLQRNLDERLSRDKDLRDFTPAERGRRRQENIRQQAERNAQDLGFPSP